MTNTILVAYATRLGSTAGIAEAIGKILEEHGLQVEVREMSEVKDLTPYSAVVAGSAIRAHEWLPEAMEFMRKNQTALSQKPFAAFLVCMTMAMKNESYRQGVRDWLNPVRALVKPVSEGFFPGVLDIARIPSFADRLKFRLSTLFGVWTEGDHRDWDAVRAWALQLKPLLTA